MTWQRNDRELVLGRVRAAVRRGTSPSRARPPADAGGLFEVAVPPGTPLDRFLARFEELGGNARVVASSEEVAPAVVGIARELGAERAALWETPAMRALGVRAALNAAGVVAWSPTDGGDARQAMAEAAVGVTGVDAVLADTATLILGTDGTRPRGVSLLPPVHVAVIPEERILATLAEWLAEARAAGAMPSAYTFVSGPSRTADIELTLTVGVHGPGAVYAVVVRGGGSAAQ